MHILHWFRGDLRLRDNTAFYAAAKEAEQLTALFVIPHKTWQNHDYAAIKVDFILENLKMLQAELQDMGVPLIIKSCDYFSQCDEIIDKLCQQHNINAVYANEQYELDEIRRDKRVKKKLKTADIELKTFADCCILPPNDVLSKKGEPLKVFTPYKKTWLQVVNDKMAYVTQNKPRKNFKSSIKSSSIPNQVTGFNNKIDLSAWPIGEEAAKRGLRTFCKEHVNDYKQDRDFPAIDGTSRLSPCLAIGVISARQCIQAMMQHLESDDFNSLKNRVGTATWLSELAWRDFYKQVGYHFPRIFLHKPFNLKTKSIPWHQSKKLYEAWCEGKTGFPLVDAAMRQLNQTGWMHNRLRMVVAMFLSKTLFLDWRLGEKYFMQHLIDGDFTANNGGWQWSASTGTDAVPYFRIFNPTRQSERFDPQGEFIRQYIPELKDVSNKAVHAPGDAYIKPIVDYKKMRDLVIKTFKENS